MAALGRGDEGGVHGEVAQGAVVNPLDAGGLEEAKVTGADDGLDIVFAREVVEGGETAADVGDAEDAGVGRVDGEGLGVGLAGMGMGREGSAGRGRGGARVEHHGVR